MRTERKGLTRSGAELGNKDGLGESKEEKKGGGDFEIGNQKWRV